MKTLKLTSLAFILALFFSCGNNTTNDEKNSDAKSTKSIEIDGSSTVYLITEAVAEEFKKDHKDVHVSIGFSGTGGGFKKFSRGETHISDASRPIKEAEANDCKANNINFLELTVAYDGLAVIANPKNTWLNDITVDELKKLWEPEAQGKIMTWNQIRPEWPNEKITLFGPGTASGTFDYFTEAINGKSGSCRGDYSASEDDNVLVQGVAGDTYALGFFGLAYYEENKDKLKLIKVAGVAPSAATVMDGTYKPLSRPLFIYVNANALSNSSIVDFVNFYLQNASKLSSEVGYISLKDEEYKVQMDKFTKFVAEHKK